MGTSVKNAAVRRDYYRVQVDDPEDDPLIVEKYLSIVEDKGASLTKQLIAGIELTDQDRTDWAEFLASTYARSPVARQLAAETQVAIGLAGIEANLASEESYNHFLEQMKADGEKFSDKVTYKDVKDFLERRDFEISVREESTLLTLTSIEKLVPVLTEMSWSVLKSPRGRFFVASDNPFTYGSPSDTWHPVYGDGGLKNKHVEVNFPLDKNHIFVGSWKGLPTGITLEPILVDLLNNRVASQALRHVYSSEPSEKMAEVFANTGKGRRRLADPNLPEISLRRTKPSSPN